MTDANIGLIIYLVALLNIGAIYAVMTLGLNLQWGLNGLFNAGIAGFFAVGAYTSAILTAPRARTSSAASTCRSRSAGSAPCSSPAWSR